MQQLEPTYLRYVYDGLSKGSISSNNPTSLPIGFIGLFEDEFPSSMPLVERIYILKRLAIWALLKGPVSIEMVGEILIEHPDNTKALIDTYSKWFNSPEPGKYVLYHDRLRTYLLQKLSDHEVQDLNETLISYLEKSLADERGDESELYALEYLSTHMLVESQLDNNYKRFHEYVNKDVLWPRQIKASNEYKWSQKGVKQSIKEAARRHNEDNTVGSIVNSVQLTKEEQSNSGQILELLNLGDFETAFSRLSSLEGLNLYNFFLFISYELSLGSMKDSVHKENLYVSLVKLVNESIDIKEVLFKQNNDIIKKGGIDAHLKNQSKIRSETGIDANQLKILTLYPVFDMFSQYVDYDKELWKSFGLDINFFIKIIEYYNDSINDVLTLSKEFDSDYKLIIFYRIGLALINKNDQEGFKILNSFLGLFRDIKSDIFNSYEYIFHESFNRKSKLDIYFEVLELISKNDKQYDFNKLSKDIEIEIIEDRKSYANYDEYYTKDDEERVIGEKLIILNIYLQDSDKYYELLKSNYAKISDLTINKICKKLIEQNSEAELNYIIDNCNDLAQKINFLIKSSINYALQRKDNDRKYIYEATKLLKVVTDNASNIDKYNKWRFAIQDCAIALALNKDFKNAKNWGELAISVNKLLLDEVRLYRELSALSSKFFKAGLIDLYDQITKDWISFVKNCETKNEINQHFNYAHRYLSETFNQGLIYNSEISKAQIKCEIKFIFQIDFQAYYEFSRNGIINNDIFFKSIFNIINSINNAVDSGKLSRANKYLDAIIEKIDSFDYFKNPINKFNIYEILNPSAHPDERTESEIKKAANYLKSYFENFENFNDLVLHSNKKSKPNSVKSFEAEESISSIKEDEKFKSIRNYLFNNVNANNQDKYVFIPYFKYLYWGSKIDWDIKKELEELTQRKYKNKYDSINSVTFKEFIRLTEKRLLILVEKYAYSKKYIAYLAKQLEEKASEQGFVKVNQKFINKAIDFDNIDILDDEKLENIVRSFFHAYEINSTPPSKELLNEAITIINNSKDINNIGIEVLNLSLILYKSEIFDTCFELMDKIKSYPLRKSEILFEISLMNKEKNLKIGFLEKSFAELKKQSFMEDLKFPIFSKIIIELIMIGEYKKAYDFSYEAAFSRTNSFYNEHTNPNYFKSDTVADEAIESFLEIIKNFKKYNQDDYAQKTLDLLGFKDRMLFNLEHCNELLDQNKFDELNSNLARMEDEILSSSNLIAIESNKVNSKEINKPLLLYKISKIYSRINNMDKANFLLDLSFKNIKLVIDEIGQENEERYLTPGMLLDDIAVEYFKRNIPEKTFKILDSKERKNKLIFRILEHMGKKDINLQIALVLNNDSNYDSLSSKFSMNDCIKLFSKLDSINMSNSVSKKLLYNKFEDFEEYKFLSSSPINNTIILNFLFYYVKSNCFFNKNTETSKLNLVRKYIEIEEWLNFKNK